MVELGEVVERHHGIRIVIVGILIKLKSFKLLPANIDLRFAWPGEKKSIDMLRLAPDVKHTALCGIDPASGNSP